MFVASQSLRTVMCEANARPADGSIVGQLLATARRSRRHLIHHEGREGHERVAPLCDVRSRRDLGLFRVRARDLAAAAFEERRYCIGTIRPRDRTACAERAT